MTTTTDHRLETIGRSAYESIAEMVTALECDYDRLEVVAGELADIEDEIKDNPDEIENLDELINTRDQLREELAELKTTAGECESQDDAVERIREDALSVEVRSGWVSLGEPMDAEEFCILLTTGGPAVRIRGELDPYHEPSRAWLETQDWGTPWTRYFDADQDTLLTYARQFYYGE
jgi:hypothetical protein